MTVSRTEPAKWMYTDGDGKIGSDDIVKEAGGYYKIHPNGFKELIHCLKTLGDVMATIVAITNNADGTISSPESLSFTVEFSEAVTVVTTGGTPSIQVYTEDGDVYDLEYASGSGTTELVFSGAPAGASDGDLVVVEEVQHNGGTILDSADQNVNNDFPSDYEQPAIVLSTAMISAVTNEEDGTYANTDDLTFVVVFDKDVTLSGSDTIYLRVTDAGETDIDIELTSGDGTDTLTFVGPATDAVDGALVINEALVLGAATALNDGNSNPAYLVFPDDYEQPAIVIETV